MLFSNIWHVFGDTRSQKQQDHLHHPLGKREKGGERKSVAE